ASGVQISAFSPGGTLGLVAGAFLTVVIAFASFAGPALDSILDRVDSPVAITQQPPAALTQHVWLWQRTEHGDGTTMVAMDPNRYTLSLRPEGRVELKTGCNSGVGTYSISGSQLTVEPMPLTLVACPFGAQEWDFHRGVIDAGRYAFEGERL